MPIFHGNAKLLLDSFNTKGISKTQRGRLRQGFLNLITGDLDMTRLNFIGLPEQATFALELRYQSGITALNTNSRKINLIWPLI